MWLSIRDSADYLVRKYGLATRLFKRGPSLRFGPGGEPGYETSDLDAWASNLRPDPYRVRGQAIHEPTKASLPQHAPSSGNRSRDGAEPETTQERRRIESRRCPKSRRLDGALLLKDSSRELDTISRGLQQRK